jgi:hypothetical protein
MEEVIEIVCSKLSCPLAQNETEVFYSSNHVSVKLLKPAAGIFWSYIIAALTETALETETGVLIDNQIAMFTDSKMF